MDFVCLTKINLLASSMLKLSTSWSKYKYILYLH